MTERVVVEIDVRVAPESQQIARDPTQRAAAGAAAVLSGRAVEAQVAEAAGETRGRRPHQIVFAEGGAERIEHLADLRHVPRVAAKLDHVPQAVRARQLLEKLRQPLGIGPVHLRRQLPEHHRELAPQPQDELEVLLDPGPRILEPLHVRQIPAALRREAEAARRTLAPAVDGGWRRQSIERRVQLDGGEDARVMLEPALRRQPARIEQVAPVVVDVSAGAEMDHTVKVHIVSAWNTKRRRLRWSLRGFRSRPCARLPRSVRRAICTRPAPRPSSAKASRRPAPSLSASSRAIPKTAPAGRSWGRRASCSIARSRKQASTASWST